MNHRSASTSASRAASTSLQYTLERGGIAAVEGKRAVVIIDKGDRPGSTPGKLYVATNGEPLPLRLIATGKRRPGGHKDPECGDDTPADAGDDTFQPYKRASPSFLRFRMGGDVFSDYNESLD